MDRLRSVENHPVLVSTSRHVTQGIIDVTNEQWAGDTLSGQSQVIAGDAYELRVAGLRHDDQQWSVAEAGLSDAAAATGCTIKILPPRENETGWVRMVINSRTSQTVPWKLRFSRGR